MDRIIEVKVNGNYLTKDNANAGTQGEVNSTFLRIEFDEGWDGFAKTITWWNAKGENPVARVLTADLLEDIADSTQVYLTAIPGEALTVWGKCMFAIDGYINGKRQKSVYASMVVKPTGDGSDVNVETPTPSQIEQLQVQIDTLLTDMAEQAIIATDAAESAKNDALIAENSANVAVASEAIAVASATSAEANAKIADAAAITVTALSRSAKISEENAAKSAQSASNDKAVALTCAKDAATNAQIAETSAQRAAASAQNLAASEGNAKVSETRAASSANAAATSEYYASTHEDAALRAAGEAKEAGSDAEAWALGTRNGIAVGSSDPAFMNNAKYYKEQAKLISGGNFATEDYVDQKVQGLSNDIDCGTF